MLIEETFRDIQEFDPQKRTAKHWLPPILLNAFLSEALETFRRQFRVCHCIHGMSPSQQKAALKSGDLDICFTKLFKNGETDPDFDYFELLMWMSALWYLEFARSV